jgi:uncharacterized protein YukE
MNEVCSCGLRNPPVGHDEVYYCGRCRRQQSPQEGELCKICGIPTISWFTHREDADTVHQRWERWFGTRGGEAFGTRGGEATDPARQDASSTLNPPAYSAGGGRYGMTQVFVDPDELEAFASRLIAFSKDVEEIRQYLWGGLRNLGTTWRDQEFEKFQQAFLQIERFLQELVKEIQNVHPKILADARYIREYLQIQPG